MAEVDRSHRKLAARGSREQLVHVSASTLRRVLASEGLVLHGRSRREPAPHPGWPDWLEWKPNRVRAYDFTHWPRADRVSIAILDMVSRRWLGTVTSVEETSTQVEVAFTQALAAEGLLELADQRTTAALRQALLSADRDRIAALADDGQLPLLLATSDNGAQMRSRSTREFLAGFAITQRFGRPSTPTDQAWIESLFGHVMGEWPHLESIRDPGELDRELDRVRVEYNTVRLHAGIGYVPRRRTRRPRRRHPPSPTRRTRPGTPSPHRFRAGRRCVSCHRDSPARHGDRRRQEQPPAPFPSRCRLLACSIAPAQTWSATVSCCSTISSTTSTRPHERDDGPEFHTVRGPVTPSRGVVWPCCRERQSVRVEGMG
ncbi:MAG TPA: integrase core domain-containing protein [Propionibacteriaceae bacterium]|nr:integrase core domain-containing protein [Propionibacteriaceae bacterium]